MGNGLWGKNMNETVERSFWVQAASLVLIAESIYFGHIGGMAINLD